MKFLIYLFLTAAVFCVSWLSGSWVGYSENPLMAVIAFAFPILAAIGCFSGISFARGKAAALFSVAVGYLACGFIAFRLIGFAEHQILSFAAFIFLPSIFATLCFRLSRRLFEALMPDPAYEDELGRLYAQGMNMDEHGKPIRPADDSSDAAEIGRVRNIVGAVSGKTAEERL